MPDMHPNDAMKLLRDGPAGRDQWNLTRQGDQSPLNLQGQDLRGFDLRGFDLRKLNLTSAVLVGCRLDKTDLTGGNLAGADLTGAELPGGNLAGVNLSGAILERATLSDSELEGATFCSASLAHADMRKANLHRANLDQAKLPDVNMAGADLRNASFLEANLTGAVLTDASVNAGTCFRSARVDACTIDRHTLESLTNYGEITKGDRMRMKILDGVVTLRASYSGFWQWVHLTALVVFLFPYASFLLKQWGRARFRFDDDGPVIPLWNALLRFIWNGGKDWTTGWDLNLYLLAMFLFSLCYNVLRGVLLWKTKSLELQQEASGLPVLFSLTGGWGWAYRIAKWSLYVNLLVVALHTIHFLQKQVPIG